MENPLEVKLSGFNVDVDGLKEAKSILEKEDFSEKERNEVLYILRNLTPETISASAARISRDPRPIHELRKEARTDVKKARASNKAIIFTMGHKSVAEHAFFNFAITGVSRRAVEELEKPRLQSYTEKSQRYITLEGDFVIPKEIQASFLEPKFIELIELQNKFYDNNLQKITDWHHRQDYSELFEALGYTNNTKKKIGTIEGLGKEDARYSLAQATQAQLVLSASARNLEVLITRLRSSDIEEFKDLGEKIFMEIDGIAPSVIKYTEPVDYFAKTRPELRKHVADLIK
ncbi:MAG: FAD-dependent thymidylate synthase, partial [Nanoarchaeota archaeon]|nr:FAD-dependent thymidylate synthase [Nanoarchaeota archaeon]